MASSRVMLLLLIIGMVSTAAPNPDPIPSFNSIYQFGESTADTGNLIRETTQSYCSSTPYGVTSFHKPTGRCSDGLLIVDFWAREFNIPLLNPYLDSRADFSHGVNFAVAGATAINTTGYEGAPTKSSLAVQIGWFQSHVKSICSSLADCKKKFERSLFVVGDIGGNDFNYDFLNLHIDVEDTFSLSPIIVQTITDAVKEVIDHGALHVLVPGIFPLGCMPAYLDEFTNQDLISITYDDLGCMRQLNTFARLHNQNLQDALKELRKQHPDVGIYYGDYFESFTWVLSNAASLGFERDSVFKPCCGDTDHPCGSTDGVGLCPDPTKRISWDGLHQTQEAYRHMAKWLLKNNIPQPTPSPSPPSPPSSSASQLLFQPSVAAILAFLANLLLF